MMKKIFRPRSLDELWRVKGEHPRATIMAGGTDLMVQLRKGVRPQPEILISLSEIGQLQEVEESSEGFALGAAATHAGLLRNRLVTGKLPLLAAALEKIGSPQIRNRGTLGGNIVTASPAGDSLPALHLLEAEVELATGPEKTRRLPLAEFIIGPGRTGLANQEILTRVIIPRPPAESRWHFEKVGLRNALAISVVSLAALWQTGEDGRTISKIALAWGSIGATVVRLPEVEDFLRGRLPNRETLTAAGRMVSGLVAPIDDLRASAAYRRQVAGNLLLRLAAD